VDESQPENLRLGSPRSPSLHGLADH